jgi:hypothetical protein
VTGARSVLAIVTGVFLAGCTGTDSGMAGSSPTIAAAVSPSSVATAHATAKPAPTPLTLTGQGAKVTSPFHLDAANYRVKWSTIGEHYFSVHVHAGEQVELLVSEINPNPSSGEAFFRANGGEYFLEIKAESQTWTITFETVGA